MFYAANHLPQLGQDVHIYRCYLDQPLTPKTSSLLSQDEQTRAQAYRFEHLTRRYTACRATLRWLLGHYLNLSPDDIAFQYTNFGKPTIHPQQNPNHLQFNVSHSDSQAIIAIHQGGLLGVDIEAIKPLDDRDAIAQQHFSTYEYQQYLTLDESARTWAFYTIWTRKEAFIKAMGEGLSYPLHAFDVSFLPHTQPCVQAIRQGHGQPHPWTLRAGRFQVDNQDYLSACIWQGEPKPVRGFELQRDGTVTKEDELWSENLATSK